MGAGEGGESGASGGGDSASEVSASEVLRRAKRLGFCGGGASSGGSGEGGEGRARSRWRRALRTARPDIGVVFVYFGWSWCWGWWGIQVGDVEGGRGRVTGPVITYAVISGQR